MNFIDAGFRLAALMIVRPRHRMHREIWLKQRRGRGIELDMSTVPRVTEASLLTYQPTHTSVTINIVLKLCLYLFKRLQRKKLESQLSCLLLPIIFPCNL